MQRKILTATDVDKNPFLSVILVKDDAVSPEISKYLLSIKHQDLLNLLGIKYDWYNSLTQFEINATVYSISDEKVLGHLVRGGAILVPTPELLKEFGHFYAVPGKDELLINLKYEPAIRLLTALEHMNIRYGANGHEATNPPSYSPYDRQHDLEDLKSWDSPPPEHYNYTIQIEGPAVLAAIAMAGGKFNGSSRYLEQFAIEISKQ